MGERFFNFRKATLREPRAAPMLETTNNGWPLSKSPLVCDGLVVISWEPADCIVLFVRKVLSKINMGFLDQIIYCFS